MATISERPISKIRPESNTVGLDQRQLKWRDLECKFSASTRAISYLVVLLYVLDDVQAALFDPSDLSRVFTPIGPLSQERYAILERLYDLAQHGTAIPWDQDDVSRLELWCTFHASALPPQARAIRSVHITLNTEIVFDLQRLLHNMNLVPVFQTRPLSRSGASKSLISSLLYRRICYRSH